MNPDKQFNFALYRSLLEQIDKDPDGWDFVFLVSKRDTLHFNSFVYGDRWRATTIALSFIETLLSEMSEEDVIVITNRLKQVALDRIRKDGEEKDDE